MYGAPFVTSKILLISYDSFDRILSLEFRPTEF